MSTFAYMRLLESSATRYDRWMRLLSGGRIGRLHAEVVRRLRGAGSVLDLGTGTGEIALRCAEAGARVVAVDRSAEMLAVARDKARDAGGPAEAIAWRELTVAELEDAFEPESFDAVAACLVLSELDEAAQRYALRSACSVLRPGGILVLGDEVRAPDGAGRVWQRIRRAPWALLGRVGPEAAVPVEALESRVAAAGFEVVEVDRLRPDTVVLTARRPEATA